MVSYSDKRILAHSLVRLLVIIGVISAFSLAAVTAQDDDGLDVQFQVEMVQPVPFVTSIVWSADGTMFLTEKFGTVRLISAGGELQEEPVVRVSVRDINEDGLQSIALDPDFETNGYFYIYYTELPQTRIQANVVARYTLVDGKGTSPLEMWRFPVESDQHLHNGGRIRFDNDGLMYISVGDLQRIDRSQDINSIESKIHRFAVLGNRIVPAPGNPFPGNSMYAFGLRNVFSFIFDPFSGRIFATENGPDCDDEINLVLPGQNYGWGIIPYQLIANYCSMSNRQQGARAPLISYNPTVAPTGIMVYDGEAFPAWQGDLFFCTFNTFQLQRVRLNDDRTAFDGEPVVVDTTPNPNCAIELAQGPDGFIYYSNLSGVYRLVPAD